MVRRSKIEIDLYNPYSLDWGEEISFPSSRNVKEYGNRIYNRYPARSIFLVPRAILASIGKNHLNVLDPFMGSGTTAVAAKALGRDYIGFEICEQYVELANARINGTQVKQKQEYSQLEIF